MEPIYTPEEAAKILRVSVRTLDRRRAAGKISYFRDGSRVFFAESHIAEYRASTERCVANLKLVKRTA